MVLEIMTRFLDKLIKLSHILLNDYQLDSMNFMI